MSTSAEHLIIAGPPRSGTTSLFTYLSKHPEVCGSAIKETYHFHPAIIDQEPASIDEYLQYFRHCPNVKYLLEATAAYFFGGDKIAAAIQRQLGPTKIIFSFRDPVDRLGSYFRHKKMVGDYPKELEFEEYLAAAHDSAERGISSGFYVGYLRGWFDYFEPNRILVVYFDELQQNPACLMRKVCDWLEIDPEKYKDSRFTVENRGALYRRQTLHHIARSVNTRFESFFRRHHALKRMLRRSYYLINEETHQQPIQPSTYNYLNDIYRPHNEQLFEFLCAKGLATGGWLAAYGNPQ